MKKFWLVLGLTLILAGWCGEGYYGFGTCPAFGQTYYSRGVTCNPNDPYCYQDYHAAPYADPLSQILYYIAPLVGRQQRYEQRYEPRQSYKRHETNRERRERERREREQQRYYQQQRY